MGLVENNVGGLIESSQGAPQEEEESHAEEGAGVCDELSGSLLLSQKKKSGSLLTTMLRPSLVMTEMTSARHRNGDLLRV
jgi:hypothetical protein